jgi:hypothetical protein
MVIIISRRFSNFDYFYFFVANQFYKFNHVLELRNSVMSNKKVFFWEIGYISALI